MALKKRPNLSAVLAQSGRDRSDHAIIEQLCATQMARSFSTHPHVAVRFSGRAMLDFSVGGQTKSLLGRFVSFKFYFGHGTIGISGNFGSRIVSRIGL